jgi:hypothetical protein
VPASTIATVQGVDGVAEVQGNVVNAQFNQVSVLGKDGKALTTNGAPIIAGNWIDSAQPQPAAGVSTAPHRADPPRSCSTASWPRRPAVSVGDSTTVVPARPGSSG